jgi:hypothetical protein
MNTCPRCVHENAPSLKKITFLDARIAFALRSRCFNSARVSGDMRWGWVNLAREA